MSVRPSRDDDEGRAWGILGGTFDPIHLGHLAVAAQTRETLDLAGVVFVPAARPPHKAGRVVTDAADRVAMVELGIAGDPGFRVSRIELERDGLSYTVESLRAFHARGIIAGAGRPDPVLILSVETLPDLPTWREPEALLELARIAVVPRRGYPPPDAGWLERAFPGRTERFLMLDGPDLGHSASAIRARVAAGRTVRYLVPDAVAAWIDRRGLYRDAEPAPAAMDAIALAATPRAGGTAADGGR
ncbi:MAG: nicotinate-nucleotide adenylyltransferase [Chloroflexi bacterium]|nr:nicotinate-nucleotide adenylyltransferase [Chloroflexota bacterium]